MPHRKPILLVDDNQNDLELIQRALKRNNIVNDIATARHGGEALDYLHRRGTFAGRGGDEPLFILLDLKMPKVDGLEVLRQVKADEKLKVIPIVMLTSSNEDRDVVQSYRLGVNAYVVKPVDFNKFVEAIGQLGFFWSFINREPLVVLGPALN